MTTANPYLLKPMRIANATRELEDVFTLSFDIAKGFSFRPGQFNMLYVHGVGEVAISISGDAAEPERLVHTVRSVGTVTHAMARLGRGDMLGVRGPYGSAWPLEQIRSRDVLVIAGGLGLAPLRAAIQHLLAHRSEFGRVTILVGARSPEQLLYREDLEKWRGRFDCRLEVTVDQAGRDWFGNVGVVTTLLRGVPMDTETAVLVCGPELMMRFVVLELRQRGVSPSSIWLAMERNMKCGIGLCGHCQFGPVFVCKDGPVHRFDHVSPFFFVREV